jgi:hypothetical protein
MLQHISSKRNSHLQQQQLRKSKGENTKCDDTGDETGDETGYGCKWQQVARKVAMEVAKLEILNF